MAKLDCQAGSQIYFAPNIGRAGALTVDRVGTIYAFAGLHRIHLLTWEVTSAHRPHRRLGQAFEGAGDYHTYKIARSLLNDLSAKLTHPQWNADLKITPKRIRDAADLLGVTLPHVF